MEEGLKIKIGAETVEVKQSLRQLEIQLKQFQKILKDSTDPKIIKSFNQEIARTQAIIKGVKAAGLSTSLNGVSGSANRAGSAMIDLNRIVQDAPFGFIAVQNNITPLFESFGRLKAETGSTGKAFRALGAGLLGPGGVFFAISAVTAALTYFSQKNQRAKKDVEETARALKSVGDIRTDATASVEGELVLVRSLTDAVLDETKSKKERNRAIQELKGINSSYFGDLNLEAKSLKTLKERTEEYTQAIIAQSVLKGFQDEITETTKQIRKQEVALKGVIERRDQLKQRVEDRLNAPSITVGGATSSNALTTLQFQLQAAENNVVSQQEALNGLKDTYGELSVAIRQTALEQINLRTLSGGGKKDKKETDALKEKIENYKQLREAVGLLRNEEQELLNLEIKLAVRDQKKNGLDNGQLDRVITDLINSANTADRTVVVPISVKPVIDTAQAVGGPPKVNPIGEQIANEIEQIAGEKQRKKVEEMALTISQELTPAFTNAFDSIVNGGRSALQAFGDIVKSIISKLAQAAIQAAIFAAILSVLPGGGTFSAGFTKSFTGLTGLKLPFGVNPLGGTSARGLAANNINVSVSGEIHGQSLRLVLDRVTRANNRLG